MGRQTTEMLKGVLEGIVLAILAARPAYGYEITASLRERGFTGIAEGTIYAVLVRIEKRGLVDVEKVPSEKGPPRKVYELNDDGRDQLAAFWEDWSFLAERLESFNKEIIDMTNRWIEAVTGPLDEKKQYRSARARMKALPPQYRETAEALERYVLYAGGISQGDVLVAAITDLADLFEQAVADGTPIRDLVGEEPVAFAEDFIANYRTGQWLEKERTRLEQAIDRAAGGTS